MKKRKLKVLTYALISVIGISMLVGCSSNSEEKSTESKTKVVKEVNDVDPEATDEYDGKEATATRTHFKEKVKTITYYNNGKKYDIKVDSEEGNKVISLMKERIATCEFLDKDTIEGKNDEIKNNGKVIEVKFEKEADNSFYDSKEDKYVNVKFDGLFMPLDGKYSQRLLLLPNENGTFTISGKPDKLINYLEMNIEK